jgi:hypothetical protein
MSWTALVLLAAGIYATKAVGPLLLASRRPSPGATRLLGLLAVPLLAALIVVQTLGDGEGLVLDARLPALGVAALCVWRGAPFLVTVLVAAATAAALRAVGVA